VSKLTSRYRLDDLRRFASALGAAVGLPRERAAALGSHLLWFDAAGDAEHGISSLPEWLERIAGKEVDASAMGRVGQERAGAAVFDAQGGLPPLLLERAAALAAEKARDVGVGLIRVTGLGAAGPAAAVIAEVAVGPMVGLILGPNGSVAVGVPTASGLPVVFDSALAGQKPRKKTTLSLAGWVVPWTLLVPDRGWLVLAATVGALEPLSTFQERVEAAIASGKEEPGLLLPAAWETRRRAAREHGLEIPQHTRDAFQPWIESLGIEPPWA
jgi:LDH2 family malate/lactate/ureidoglycolate dehydrogenase